MSRHSSQSLSKEDQRKLLEIARRAIVEAILHERAWVPTESLGALMEPRGVFVTLRLRGALRGCIGRVESPEPLAHGAARCAVAAATEDARFRRLQTEEISAVLIEISVLSDLEPIRPHEIEIGRHGLMVFHGSHSGILLPQVAVDHQWTPQRFLQETCEKAGLPREAWKSPETRIRGFTAGHFSEADLALGAFTIATR